MSKYEWNESLSVNNEEVDNEHKGLFELVNELDHADKTRGLLADIIGRLENYANVHFSHEEKLMKEMGFPGYEEHVKKHRAFVEWLDTVKITYRRAAESPFLIGDLVNKFLKEWLVEHIQKEDMKYRDFILGKKD